MEQLIFSPSDLLNLSFSVNIDGTNAIPSEIRCVINNNGNLIVAKATQSEEKYVCCFDLHQIQNLSTNCLLTIEVILNNKIYIPIKRSISIVNNATVDFDKKQDTAITVVSPEIDPEPIIPEPKEQEPVEIEFSQPVEKPKIDLNLLNSVLSSIEEDKKIEKKTIKFDKITKPEKQKSEFIIPISESKIGTKVSSVRKIKPRDEFDFKISEGKVIFK